MEIRKREKKLIKIGELHPFALKEKIHGKLIKNF